MVLFVDVEKVSSDFSFEMEKIKALLQDVLYFLKIEEDLELSVRLVDKKEIQALNLQYRQKDKPTNVLSFPCDIDLPISPRLLGDLVVCSAVVNEEAKAQGKSFEAHWSHILIHGLLHLLGYDHIEEDEAEVMEDLERKLLAKLGYDDPYHID